MDSTRYRYQIKRAQHRRLYQLATDAPDSVFYVFPYCATSAKLSSVVPHLLRHTWCLPVDPMEPSVVFGNKESKTVWCEGNRARTGPNHYDMTRASRLAAAHGQGVSLKTFTEWREWRRNALAPSRRDPASDHGLFLAVAPPLGSRDIG